MNSMLASILLLVSLLVAMAFGGLLGRRLPEHHLDGATKDTVKVAMGLVATMSALLLGLLVSSAKGNYDTERGEVSQMAAKVALIDRALSAFGPEAKDVRSQFRSVVEGVIN